MNMDSVLRWMPAPMLTTHARSSSATSFRSGIEFPCQFFLACGVERDLWAIAVEVELSDRPRRLNSLDVVQDDQAGVVSVRSRRDVCQIKRRSHECQPLAQCFQRVNGLVEPISV